MRRILLLAFVVPVLALAALSMPVAAMAHHHHHSIHIGVGPLWWGPWWGPWWSPPVYVPAPAPIYVPPPCRDVWVEGHWAPRPSVDRYGFTTYHQVWVPGHWERVCP